MCILCMIQNSVFNGTLASILEEYTTMVAKFTALQICLKSGKIPESTEALNLAKIEVTKEAIGTLDWLIQNLQENQELRDSVAERAVKLTMRLFRNPEFKTMVEPISRAMKEYNSKVPERSTKECPEVK